MDTPAAQPSGKELLKEFLSLPLEHCTRTLTHSKLMAIAMYLSSKPKDDEYYSYIRKSEAGLTWSRSYRNKITAKIYKAADLNMDVNYRPITRSDSVKNDNYILTNLPPHQDYGVTYTRVGVTRPDNGVEDILKLYEEKGHDVAFIAWTDPELVKVVALMLMCGMHRTEVAVKVNRSYNAVRDIENQLMTIGYLRGTITNNVSYNYLGHFLQKLIDITKFDRSKGVEWNFINVTFPVKQPDLYFPYAGYRYTDADPKLKPLFRGVEGFSYAFYRCKNSKTGRTYTDRADNWNLFFCPQSNIMHYDMDMYIDLMAQVVKPHHRLKHPFIEAILGTFMTGKIETILENYDEDLYQAPGSIVTYILALMNRFPDRIKPIDPRRELSVTTPLTREKWLTDPRLKYLLVYQYFLMEVIRGRPTFQGIVQSTSGNLSYDEIMFRRGSSATPLNHTPKYDPYKFHADRSDEETLEEVGDKVQRNKGGRTVVKLFNGVWEEEIIKNTIWDVCTKHSLIEFNNKMYRSRVDAHRNIQNKSYIRPGMTHRPNYLDWPIALKDILPLIGIHRRRTHNIFNYVLKYHIKKHKISPFKTNYCQIEERKDKIVLTAGLNRLNLTHLQWIDILEYLRIHAFIGDFSYINNDRLSILSSNQLSVDNAEDDTDE